jgi:integrase
LDENEGIRPFDPKTIKRVPAAEMRPNQIGVNTVEEFNQILAVVRSPRFRDMLIFAFYSGARPKEWTDLRCRHVNPKTLVCTYPFGELSAKKAAKGEPRIIYSEPAGKAVLARLTAGKKPEDFVFVNKDGNQWTEQSIKKQFKRIKRKTGVNYYMYSLRVGFITRMLTPSPAYPQGMPITILARLCGHSDTKIISRHYDTYSKNPSVLQNALDHMPSA